MNNHVREHKRSLIFLSAVLFALSFHGLWIVVFFFFIPILILINYTIKLTFFDGMLWGSTFFALHWISLWYVLYWQGSGIVQFFLLLFLLVYCSLYAGFWVISCSWATKNYGAIGWMVTTGLYFYIIHSILLWPFGAFQGYPLSFVLVPLCYRPESLALLVYCNKGVLVLCLILFQYFLVQKNYYLLLLSIFPFLIGPLLHQKQTIPESLKKIQFVFLPEETDTQERMYHAIKQCSNKPNKTFFVFPESYFGTSLTENSYIIKTLHDNCLQEGQTMLFGTGLQKKSKNYNALFLMQYCRIIQTYEKSHLIPFFEYNPYQNNPIGIFTHFFFHKGNPFIAANFLPKAWIVKSIGQFIPVICSELFWHDRTNCFPGLPLICCMNDSYFGPFGFGQIMLLNAQLVAIIEKRFLAYCGSKQAYLIGSNGTILETF